MSIEVEQRQVRKRDGQTIQMFDTSKVAAAIRGAWNEVGGVDEKRIETVARNVMSSVPGNEVVDIEHIQNLVEYELMRNQLFDVGKAYMLYRAKRSEMRSARRHPDPLAVSDYIHAGKYARYRESDRRREVYAETVARDEDMHLRKFGHIPGMRERIKKAFKFVYEKKLLPSMRSMQFGGKAIEVVNNRIYNCLGQETAFITREGVKKFSDFNDGDETVVLTHTGNWKKAKVKSYGKQQLFTIKFSRGGGHGETQYEVRATRDHSWILEDGTRTRDLSVKHKLVKPPQFVGKWKYEDSNPEQRVYWAMGYVYGDGTLVKDGEGIHKYSMVRLCGADKHRFMHRFQELGYATSSPPSCNGDAMAYTGHYLKTLPTIEEDGFDNVVAFVRGYLDADGHKNPNGEWPSPFDGIQSSDGEAINFIRKMFPVVGAYITRERDLTGQETNYGIRPETSSFGLVLGFANASVSPYIVRSFTESSTETVWCLEVEDDHSFVLSNGIVTGNCSATHIDRLDAFSQGFYLLLCGCGVGYSVQFEHVDKLPEFSRVDESKVVHHVIQDSIEGWADAVLALLRSYVDGTYIEFAYHLIRAEGMVLKTSGGKAPGHVALKQALELVRDILNGAQGRRLRPVEAHRIMCHLADAVLSGGIRRSAMISLFSLEDSEMMYLKTGDWYKREPYLENANNSVVLKRDDVKHTQFMRVFQMTKQFGEPGFIFVADLNEVRNPCAEIALNCKLTINYEVMKILKDRAKRGKPMPDVRMGEVYSGYAFCVSGDTKLLTRDGITDIASAVGKQIEIWNGKSWQTTEPFVTGTGRKLYRVHFGDGSYLDCTDNHKFLVKDRFMSDYIEAETKNLTSISKYTLHVPRSDVTYDGGIEESDAYEYGFFLGDGHIDVQQGGRYQYLKASLYDVKVDLPLRGNRGRLFENGEHRKQDVSMNHLDMRMCEMLKTYDTLPEKLFSWNANSILKFVAGWADADGSNANDGIRIYGSEGRIRSLQLLLTKTGINSSVNFMSNEGSKTNFGERQVAMWYVQIVDARKIKCNRLTTKLGSMPTSKGLYQTIRKIEELAGEHTTYCLEEKELHTCLFNNVITKQCNLTEINAAKLKSREDFIAVGEAAALIGTLQAAYTDMPYLGWVSEVIAEREALLGVGMTGIMDSPEIALDADMQRDVASRIVEWNGEFAEMIGIRPAARTTTVKPSGTTALELGSVGSGIHAHHARRYIRSVTANKIEAVFNHFRATNPHMCVMKPNGDYVIEFPVTAPEGAIVKSDLGAIEFMNMVMSTQQNWVNTGTARPESSPGYTHNVSNTIHVKPSEWDAVAAHLWEHRALFSGVSFIPVDDTVYPFAPFQAIITEADESRWNQLLAHYKPVDYTALIENEDATDVGQEPACAGGSCEIPVR